eukprot:m.177379 g.177379  ORF g.177379 m.177379 type:complete len:95 (+) comp39158_c2_seq57:332-616(+)
MRSCAFRVSQLSRTSSESRKAAPTSSRQEGSSSKEKKKLSTAYQPKELTLEEKYRKILAELVIACIDQGARYENRTCQATELPKVVVYMQYQIQ